MPTGSSTHGYFLQNETAQVALDDSQRSLDRSEIALGDLERANLAPPLTRSFLFVANSNRDPKEILSALEMANVNLWGTKLVVLSACDTGVGDVKNGECVYGMRRALVLAGSEAQLMSLWPVSDTGTRELMAAYYAQLKAGAGLPTALRQVQLKLLSQPKRSHPYYWTSFIQSGEWANLEDRR